MAGWHKWLGQGSPRPIAIAHPAALGIVQPPPRAGSRAPHMTHTPASQHTHSPAQLLPTVVSTTEPERVGAKAWLVGSTACASVAVTLLRAYKGKLLLLALSAALSPVSILQATTQSTAGCMMMYVCYMDVCKWLEKGNACSHDAGVVGHQVRWEGASLTPLLGSQPASLTGCHMQVVL